MLLVSTNFTCTSLTPLYVPSTLSSISNYIEEADGETAKGHRYSPSGVPRCIFSWKKTSHLFDPCKMAWSRRHGVPVHFDSSVPQASAARALGSRGGLGWAGVRQERIPGRGVRMNLMARRQKRQERETRMEDGKGQKGDERKRAICPPPLLGSTRPVRRPWRPH
ncbi:hypothetical protein CI102_15042 [Trichoderma harzianum]|nr:hypothetical protein CI102_15042 [Trichoderma harzianum]